MSGGVCLGRVAFDLAIEVAKARAEGVPYKVLAWKYRRSRKALAEAARWGSRLTAAANDDDANGVRLGL